MWAILVALCFASTAEAWVCQCGLFADSQLDNQDNVEEAAFALWGANVDVGDIFADLCGADLAAASEACEFACHDWFDGQYGEEFGYCFRAPDGTSRCYGGLFCEVLQAENYPDVENDRVNMFDRIPECFTEWDYSVRQLAADLCCESGLWIPCNDETPACDCYGGSGELCECGVFSPDQFEPIPGPPSDAVPLPVAYVGADVPFNASEGFCDELGTTDDSCMQLCETSGNEAFATTSLDDWYPFAANNVTYGQAYCGALEARGYQLSDDYATNLYVYQRAPTCEDQDDWVQLLDVVYDLPLCCDREGNHRPDCLPVEPAH